MDCLFLSGGNLAGGPLAPAPKSATDLLVTLTVIIPIKCININLQHNTSKCLKQVQIGRLCPMTDVTVQKTLL